MEMKEMYWAAQVGIQRQEVAAWLAYSEGKSEEALAGMRAAVVLEDKTEKNAVTPGPLVPARELLAELLLELKRPSEALKEYESALSEEPNRFWSLYGAAQAAKRAGDEKAAQSYDRKLLIVARPSDKPGRRELIEARSDTKQR
jgi:tetratricopeptide (TPR) repeat protein